MKSHKIFNFALYRDMLRQLRLVGVAFTIICLVISLVVPVAIALQQRNENDYNSFGYLAQSPDAAAVTPVLWGFMYVGGLLLALAAFSFLNKRNGSDFFHSMPNTALATWTSVAAAVATWIVGIVVSTVLLTMVTYSALNLAINWSMAPYLIGYFSIGTLLVASAAMVAVSLTGTTITNLALTALILFLPRGLMLMVTSAIESRAIIVPLEQMGLLNPAYHIAFGVFADSDPIHFTGGFWYSAVLVLVFSAAAALLYRIRRSETAEKSAPSRLLQHVFRSAIVLPLVIFPTLTAAADRTNFFRYIRENPEIILVFWCIAIVIYYVYELITTKRLKNLLTITPLFLALSVVSSVLVWIAVVTVSDSLVSRVPAVDTIQSVRAPILSQTGSEYGVILAGEMPITDPEIVQILHNTLAGNVALIQEDKGLYESGYNSALRVEFQTKQGNVLRQIRLKDADYIRLVNRMQQMDEYTAYLRMLPETRHINRYGMIFASEYQSHSMTNPAQELWPILRNELAQMSDADFFAASNQPKNGYVLEISGTLPNGERFSNRYAITGKTPQTLAALTIPVNRGGKEAYAKLRDFAASGGFNKEERYGYLTATVFNVPELEEKNFYLDAYYAEETADLEEFLALLPAEAPDILDMQSPHIVLSFYFNNNVEYVEGVVILPLSDEQAETLAQEAHRFLAK